MEDFIMAIAQRMSRFSLRTALVSMVIVAIALGIMRQPGQRAAHLANVLRRGDRNEISLLLSEYAQRSLPYPLRVAAPEGGLTENEFRDYLVLINVHAEPPTIWQFLSCRRTVTVEGSGERCELEISFKPPKVLSTTTSADFDSCFP